MEKVQFSVDDYSSKDYSLHQKYVNTCTLNGDGDSFGVTDHKAEERLVSTVENTSAGSIRNCENEPMLEERSVSEAGNISTSFIQNFENESMLVATDRSTRTGFQIPEKVEIARDSNANSGKLECLENLVCNILPEFYMNGSDVGENSIISNILSFNFDSHDIVLSSPHNLANFLLVETDK